MTCGIDIFDHLQAGHLTCEDSGHRAALARRAPAGPPWGEIVRGHDAGGQRDFLEGRPINCGAGLELQSVEERSDDYGEYLVSLPTGIRVRYELDVPRPGEEHRRIVLHALVGGHQFLTAYRAGMRFRWPSAKTGGA